MLGHADVGVKRHLKKRLKKVHKKVGIKDKNAYLYISRKGKALEQI